MSDNIIEFRKPDKKDFIRDPRYQCAKYVSDVEEILIETNINPLVYDMVTDRGYNLNVTIYTSNIFIKETMIYGPTIFTHVSEYDDDSMYFDIECLVILSPMHTIMEIACEAEADMNIEKFKTDELYRKGKIIDFIRKKVNKDCNRYFDTFFEQED